MNAKLAFLKNFVKNHRVAIAVGVTTTMFLLLMMRNAKELNKFLEEHNLLEAYYAIEE